MSGAKKMSLAGKWFGFGRSAEYDAGMRAYDRGNYEAAVEAFSACLKRSGDPANLRLARFYLAESLTQLALSQLRAGNAADAARSIEKAIELHPNYADLRFHLARARGAAGDSGGELEALEQALELNPKYAEALFYRGTIWLAMGEDQRGLEEISRAVKMESSLGGEPFETALRAHESGDRAAALGAFREIAGVERDPANQHARRAESLVRQSNLEEAFVEYEEALRLAPRYADVRCRYGQALAEADRLEEATEQFRKALEINPKYVEAHAQLGIALKRMGKLKEARSAFKRAAQLDPVHVIAAQELTRL